MKRLGCAIFFLALCYNAFGGTLVPLEKANDKRSSSLTGFAEVKIKSHIVTAKIVSKPEEQTRGYMFKPAIADNEAMLFVYPRDDVYSFWMKNTRFALDIIWLGADKKAVHIKENFLPCVKDPCPVETPAQKARYVLEVKSGTVKKTAFKLGDRVDFNLP